MLPFNSAHPFRHLVSDDFLDTDFARKLLHDFPSFQSQYCLTNNGRVRAKHTPAILRDISPVYKKLNGFLSSKTFLKRISALTGVNDILYESDSSGAYIDEAFQGQELLPFRGFDFHHRTHRRRCLTFFIFLNDDWHSDWGGQLELYSYPVDTCARPAVSYDLRFNRAIVMETGERCWYGFRKICLPDNRRTATRKLVAFNLYTSVQAVDNADRYEHQALPRHFAMGKVLTETDVTELQTLAKQRNELIELRERFRAQNTGAVLQTLITHDDWLNIPVLGYALIKGRTTGLYGDGWAGKRVQTYVQVIRPATGFTLTARPASNIPNGAFVSVFVSGTQVSEQEIEAETEFALWCPFSISAGVTIEVTIVFSESVVPAQQGRGPDARYLSARDLLLMFEHT